MKARSLSSTIDYFQELPPHQRKYNHRSGIRKREDIGMAIDVLLKVAREELVASGPQQRLRLVGNTVLC